MYKMLVILATVTFFFNISPVEAAMSKIDLDYHGDYETDDFSLILDGPSKSKTVPCKQSAPPYYSSLSAGSKNCKCLEAGHQQRKGKARRRSNHHGGSCSNSAVPIPSSALLLTFGVIIILGFRRRKKN